MRIRPRLMHRLSRTPALLALNLALLALLALAILATPVPGIQATFGEGTVNITADRAWVLLPRQCVNVSWALEDIASLRVDGNEQAGSSEIEFCPTLNATSLNFEITALNGESRTFPLNIQDLPAAVITCLALLALLLPFLIAFYFVATMRLAEPIPISLSQVLGLMTLLLVFLLIQTARPFTIDDVLNRMRDGFARPQWQVFGWVSAGLVFVPLVLQALRQGIQKRLREDFVVIAAFFVFIFLLYLPFGFDSIWQYEEWGTQALLEGRPSKIADELITRFWLHLIYPLANVTNVNPIVFHHLAHVGLTTAKLAMLYGIVRKLNVAPFYAFLITVLAMVYPVNAFLMSSRSAHIAVSVAAFLAALYLVLLFEEKPSRLRLLGILLALFFSVGIYEITYAIIALVPILWWRHRSRSTWHKINLTVIWYLVPAAKLIYLLVLANSNLKFYGAQQFAEAGAIKRSLFESISHYAGVVGNVYLQSFWRGWEEAIGTLDRNDWIVPTIVAIALVGAVAFYLAKSSKGGVFPSRRQALMMSISGLLFIIPSIAVLMFFERYQNELFRLYIYVPFGAAAVVMGVLLSLASPIKNLRLRHAFIVGLSLLLMFPALSRLFVQHAHFVKSANAKAKVLSQIIEQVPYFDANSRLMLVTAMSPESLDERGVSELWTSMLDSAIYILYQEARPKVAFLCVFEERCSTNDIDIEENELRPDADYSETVLFRLNDDLTVELMPELPLELGAAGNTSYNPDRLIDTSAPLPPRALTLLGDLQPKASGD